MMAIFQFFISFGITLAITLLFGRAMGLRSRKEIVALVGLWALLAIAAASNVYEWTVVNGGTLDDPAVAYEQDHFRYAVTLCKGEAWAGRIYPKGPAFLMAAVMRLFGINVIYVLATNALLTLTSVAVIALTTQKLLERRCDWSRENLATAAIVGMGICTCFVFNAVRMWKEPMLYLATAVSAYAMVKIYDQERFRILDFGAIVIAGLLFCFTRPTCLILIAAAVALLCVSNRCKNWKPVLGIIAIAALFWWCSVFVSRYDINYYQRYTNTGGEGMTSHIFVSPTQAPVESAMGDYYSYPWWKKAAMLPATMALQFAIPLPWSLEPLSGFSDYLPRVNYGWYLIGGIVLFYFLFMWWRRRIGLKMWGLVALMCYAAPAYMCAGTISRYALPFLAMIVPIAIYVIATVKASGLSRLFSRVMAGYAVLLVIGLSGAYYVQHRSIKEKYGEDVNVREEVRDPFKGLYVEKDSAGHFYLPTTE